MNEVCSCPLQTSNFQNPYDIPFYWWVHEELSIIPVQLDCTIPYIQQMIRGFGQCSNSFQEVHFLTKYKSTVSTKTIRVSDETPGILKGDKKRNLLVNFTIASRDELQRILDRYVKQPGKKKRGSWNFHLSPLGPWPRRNSTHLATCQAWLPPQVLRQGMPGGRHGCCFVLQRAVDVGIPGASDLSQGLAKGQMKWDWLIVTCPLYRMQYIFNI